MKIALIDCGVSNIHSALKAFKHFTPGAYATEDAKEAEQADALVLPGVGSFPSGMEGLKVRGLTRVIQSAAAAGKPILGICLGAQLFLSKGFEFEECEGLGIIPGDVVAFPSLKGEKVPHMGWNSITPKESWTGTPLEGIPSGSEMYFVHSFVMQPSDPSNVLAETLYGGHRFASVVRRGSVYGCQFHPEKSADIGLKIIENFVSLVAQGQRERYAASQYIPLQ